MKFLRLRIANYRGITASDVKFSAAGITLVQGPNEVGKTSLGEAIGLLFEYFDSSKHRDIEAIRTFTARVDRAFSASTHL